MLACLLCLSIALPGAAGVPAAVITPIDGQVYYYRKVLSDTGITLMLPTNMGYRLHTDEPDVKILSLYEPDASGASFTFFAIHAPEYGGADLSAMDEADIRALLSYISDLPDDVEYAVETHLYGDTAALRAWETRSFEEGQALSFAYLLTLQGEWLVNLAAVVEQGEQALQEEQLAEMEALCAQMLMASRMPVVRSYEIPGTRMHVALPEEMPLLLLLEEEAEIKGSILQPGNPDLSLFGFHALQDEAYQGQTVMTLPEDVMQVILQGLALHEQAVVLQNGVFAEGVGAMLVQDQTATQLFAIQDGWIVVLSFLHILQVDSEKAFALQEELLERIVLGEQTPVAVPEFP